MIEPRAFRGVGLADAPKPTLALSKNPMAVLTRRKSSNETVEAPFEDMWPQYASRMPVTKFGTSASRRY